MNQSDQDPSVRIATLERELRRQRLTLRALLLSVLATVTIAFTVPHDDVVSAKRFVVLDDAGNSRAVLGMFDEQVEIEDALPRNGPRRSHWQQISTPALRIETGAGEHILLGATADRRRAHLEMVAAPTRGRRARTWHQLLTPSALVFDYEDDEIDISTSLRLGELELWTDYDPDDLDEEAFERHVQLSCGEDGPPALLFEQGDTQRVIGLP